MFALAAATVFALAACSDDTDNPYAHTSTISVVDANVNFDALADTGTVHTSAAISKVNGGASWLHATLKNDTTLTVVVDTNTNLTERYARLVLYNGSDSTAVTVQQMGSRATIEVPSNLHFADAGSTRAYLATSNVGFHVLSADSWLTATVKGDSLSVTAAANTTGAVRQGVIKYQYGSTIDSVVVSQFDFSKDVAGTYRLYYSDPQSGKMYYMNATVSQSALKFTDDNMSLATTFDSETGLYSLKSGQYMGTFSNNGTTYYLYNIFFDASMSTASDFSTSESYSFAFGFDSELGTYAETAAGCSWGDISIAAFSDKSFSEDALKGWYDHLAQPILVRTGSAAAKSARLAKAKKVNLHSFSLFK